MKLESAQTSNRSSDPRWWFIGGFLLVFFVMLQKARTFYLSPSGGGGLTCALWQFYVMEIRRAASSSGQLTPTMANNSEVITIVLWHVLGSCVGGAVMLGLGFAFWNLDARLRPPTKRLITIAAAILLLVWFCAAWMFDDRRWFLPLYYATLGAVVFALLVASRARPRHTLVYLSFAIGCIPPLALILATRPRGFFGRAILPLDFSFLQSNLVDLFVIWCSGSIGALIAHYIKTSPRPGIGDPTIPVKG